MPLARPVVLGNWKMNGLKTDGLSLVGRLAAKATHPTGTLGVFPPATLVAAVAQRLGDSRHHARRPGLPSRPRAVPIRARSAPPC